MKSRQKLINIQIAIFMKQLDKVQKALTQADNKYQGTKYREDLYKLINCNGRMQL